MTQTWHDLLFAHWAVDVRALRSRVPAPFELDLFDGQAWIGIVPFRMTNVAPRGIPPWRFLSEFPELNVRTYVKVADRPGVYFFSLDAGSSLAVRGARTLLNLPYHLAAMTVTARENAIDYDSRRSGEGPAAVFVATYEPLGAGFIPAERSLEFFLTERYLLVQPGPSWQTLSPRDPPSTLGASIRPAPDRPQHHGRGARAGTAQSPAARSLRDASGHGRVAADRARIGGAFGTSKANLRRGVVIG